MGDVLVPVGEVLRRWTRPDAPGVPGGPSERGLTDSEAVQLLQAITDTFAAARGRDLTGVYLEALRRAPVSFDEALNALVEMAADPERSAFVPSVGDIVAACRPRLAPLAHRPFEPDRGPMGELGDVERRHLAAMRAALDPQRATARG